MVTKAALIQRLEEYLQTLRESEVSQHELRRVYRRVWGVDKVVIESIEPTRLKAIEDRLDYLISNSDRSVCRFGSDEIGEPQFPQFMVARGPRGREEGNNKLSRWLKDASTLTVVDPYFVTPGGYRNAEDYSEALEIIFAPALKELEVFFNSDYREEQVANWLNEAIKNKRVSRTFYATKEIHDRIWIKERKDDGAFFAKVIGCSFHNLGRKPTYILDLPNSDLDEYMKHLRFLRGQSEVSHSV